MSSESRRLAQAVGAALQASTGAPLRGVVKAPIRTLDELSVPSILVEVGCITNETTAQTLMDPVYQGRIARGIANGIEAFAARREVVVDDGVTERDLPNADEDPATVTEEN